VAGVDEAAFSLSVVTPTYNRAHLLPGLYQSLLRQASERTEWVIVDDGSTDDTPAVVAGFIAEDRLRIQYLRKANGGKHTALNVGIAAVATRLTIIVDSDDELADGAAALIETYDTRYRDRRDLAGFSFLRVRRNGSPLLSGELPADEFTESYIEGRINRGLDGDMAEAFYTDRLQEFPFPEIAGERFIAEDVVWIRMALKYKLVFVNKPIYICEYLPGGLTNAGRAMAIGSPLGAMERAKLLMLDQCRFRSRLKGAALYTGYGRFAGRGPLDLLRDSGHPVMCLVALPFGIALHWLWKRRYS
jgi:glycosyltransferase involved in cell wall biosynthesis